MTDAGVASRAIPRRAPRKGVTSRTASNLNGMDELPRSKVDGSVHGGIGFGCVTSRMSKFCR